MAIASTVNGGLPMEMQLALNLVSGWLVTIVVDYLRMVTKAVIEGLSSKINTLPRQIVAVIAMTGSAVKLHIQDA